MTFSLAATSARNIVMLLSPPFSFISSIASSFGYHTPPISMPQSGQSQGWFFQYPGDLHAHPHP